ncbi:hypothetical protein JMJ55_07825 [Belnapia sp. T6]|uniref:Pyruvate carboxyltransferase domain-containing protein n=1 Tax=Belnapia mucosa TaxID=2804532 RepID=A0ABS1V1T5_9PROT|nr:hypothetical protein [Belnapia mucosa]MBL6455227.1 hypothetical protein [Belnapia mucosa]
MSDLPSAAEMEEIAGAAAPPSPDVTLCECFPEDGLRGAAAAVPTDAKIALIADLVACGLRSVAATAFEPPDASPAFADAEILLRGLARPPGIAIRAGCADPLAVRRALVAQDGGWGPEELALAVPQDEDWTGFEAMVALARGRFLLTGIVEARFDRADENASGAVVQAAERLATLGVTRIAIADGAGAATPPRVRDLIGWLNGALPTATFIARFTDHRGLAMANSLAAVEAGITALDCALGGAGGLCATEDLAAALVAMGHGTGLDLAALCRSGEAAEAMLGRRLDSRVLRGGAIPA